MRIDCHVHAVTSLPGHGRLSSKVRGGLPFNFVRWRLGISGFSGPAFERDAEAALVHAVNSTRELDAAVVLALDAVHDGDGRLNLARTHIHVTNDYVAALAQAHPKMLFGASVHPYRKDAVAELERCVRLGAVLLKWLPVVQDFDPSDPRCFPLYEALAHHKLPLLCHTGGESSLPVLNMAVADPALLVPALQRGVVVIAAHCGTRGGLTDVDYLPAFLRLAHEHEHLYGDTAALNVILRTYAYSAILKDEVVRRKLVHGSDWPLMPLPPGRLGPVKVLRLVLGENNWLRRDLLIKRALGFEDAYWHRAATLLRLPEKKAEAPLSHSREPNR